MSLGAWFLVSLRLLFLRFTMCLIAQMFADCRNPLIYKIGAAASDANAFNDAVEGSNMGCGFDAAFPAVKGWDAATGQLRVALECLRSCTRSVHSN